MKAYDIIKTVRLTEKDPLKVSLIRHGGGRHSGQQISDP